MGRTHVEIEASRRHLRLLELAAKESDTRVDAILGHLIDTQQEIDTERVAQWLETGIEHTHPAARVVVPDNDAPWPQDPGDHLLYHFVSCSDCRESQAY